MPLGVYLKKDVRGILVGLVAAAIEAHAAGGEANREHIAGVLALGKGMALSFGLSWSEVLADARSVLGAVADGPIGETEKTIELQIFNIGNDPLQVTSFQLTGSEAFSAAWSQGEWTSSAETAAGIDFVSPIEIEGGASRVMQVQFTLSPLEAVCGELCLKFGPSSRVRVDWIRKDSPCPDQDEE
jgi:hypothetical protein